MAKFNEIFVGRFNNALKKVFAMKGPAPSPQVAGEITPVISLLHGVEGNFLEEWTRFGFNQNVAGVAADVAAIRIRNPIGSNIVAVFNKIRYVNSNASTDFPVLTHGAATLDLATVILGAARISWDPRGRPSSALIISQTNAAVIGDFNVKDFDANPAQSRTDFILYEDQEVVLLPGDGLQLRNTTLANGLIGTFWWRERFLEDTERQ